MRKINVVTYLLLMAALLLTGCKSAAGSGMDEKDAVVPVRTEIINLKVGNPGNFGDLVTIPKMDTGYVKLDDINPEAVHEIKLGFNSDPNSSMVKETDDGFLYGSMARPGAMAAVSVVSKDIKNVPQIKKIDKTGKVLWEKEYDHKSYSGRMNNLLVYPDGSFIFSIQTYPYSKGTEIVFEKSFIIRCDAHGKELWKKDFEDYSGGLIQNLFLTENDEIIAVGQWRVKNGRQTKDYVADDIVITKLDRDGNVLGKKGFGGSDFDSINTARYDREFGIIINGRTQSNDGDFAIGKDRRYSDFIACIDEKLDLKWVAHAKENENFIYDQLVVEKGYVYVHGVFAKGGGAPVTGFIIKLDKNGKRVWTKSHVYSGMWGSAMSILKNGDIAIGSGQQNKGSIVIVDKNGSEKRIFGDLKFAPKTIVPTCDGGFIVIAIREIKCVPQPVYISSIWFDTEVVAVKSNSDYMVEWQKTYDRYKDTKDSDFALPLEDGSIMVE